MNPILSSGLVDLPWWGYTLVAHNNHHAYPTSAKFSIKPYEFDLGWVYVRAMEALGLARVKHVAPVPHFTAPKAVVDQQTLQAVITHRYDVLARFGKAIRRARKAADARALQTMVSMRRDLTALWQRSAASREELVRQLQDWCKRAEASGIRPLVEFSQRLRSYG